MTITLGTCRRPVRRRRKNFFAATAFRRDWTRMSSTLPCWSTAPQVPLCAVELDEHLIQVPFVAQPPTTTAQLVRILLPEPLTPGPHRLIGHVDTTSEHQLLHIAEAIASGSTTSSQLMISGGNRNPVYDEPAAVTIVDPAPPHLPGSPT